MKRKSIIAIVLAMITVAALCSLLIFSSAGEDDPVVLIEAGVTKWKYSAMSEWQFRFTSSNWIKNSGTTRWSEKASPFGDRIDPDNGSNKTGWKGDTHVLLLVTTFNISDLSSAKEKEFVANIFYDNTMTVYLNGTQVFYDEGWVDSYVDLTFDFSSALKSGSNILAISLEDDMGGREFDMTLTMRTPGKEDHTPDPSLTVTDKQLAETGLSTIYINTDNGDYVKSRLEYSDATMRIDLSDEYSEYTNLFTEDAGADIKIKGRGNSTWNNGYPDGKQNTLGGDTHTRKVPYTVKLSKKADLFGMGKSKKWVLLANYMDRTMLRNKLIYDLSGRMGMVFCKSVYVNLVLNGEYMGTYALTQKVDVDLFDGEVTDFEDIAEDFAKGVAKKYGWDENRQSAFEDRLCADMSWLTSGKFEGYTLSDYVDMSEYSLYTGYLIEYDGYEDEDSFFRTNHNIPLKVSNMEAIKTNPTLFNYIRDLFNDFEEACYGTNFTNSKGKHYSEYVDMNSLVDCYILNTVILNVEFGYKSMYMYINSDGIIVFGPCWDYDWSSGNPFLGANGDYDRWYNDGRVTGNNKWYNHLYADPYFVSLVRERWAHLSAALDDMVDSIDYYYNKLYKASVLEYNKFSNDPYERDFARRTGGRTFKNECDQLKNFLKNRIAWLNTQFAKRDPNIDGRGIMPDTSLRLSLSGSSITSGNSLSDYRLTSSAASYTLSMTSGYTCTAEIWINGVKKYTISLSGNVAKTQSLSGKDLSPGVNVITVYQYIGSTMYGVNYLTVSVNGEKRATPVSGDYTKGYDDKIPSDPGKGDDTPVDPPAVTTTTKPAATTKPGTGKPSTTTTTPDKTPEVTDPPKTPPTASDPPKTNPPVTEPPSTTVPETEPGAPPVTDDKGSGNNTTVTKGTSPVTSPVLPTDPDDDNNMDTDENSWIMPAVIIGIIVVAAAIGGIAVILIKKKTKE